MYQYLLEILNVPINQSDVYFLLSLEQYFRSNYSLENKNIRFLLRSEYSGKYLQSTGFIVINLDKINAIKTVPITKQVTKTYQVSSSKISVNAGT